MPATSHAGGTSRPGNEHGHDHHQPSRTRSSSPAARARCWASRVRVASPSRLNPTTAGAKATIGQASAAVRPEPGPSTNTRATGTAVADQQRGAEPGRPRRPPDRSRSSTPRTALRTGLGGGRQPGKDQLQQRRGQHRVRQQVEGVAQVNRVSAPWSPLSLAGAADQQHASCCSTRPARPAAAIRTITARSPGGEPQPRPQPQPEPGQRNQRWSGPAPAPRRWCPSRVRASAWLVRPSSWRLSSGSASLAKIRYAVITTSAGQQRGDRGGQRSDGGPAARRR